MNTPVQFDSMLVESVSDGMVAISPEGRILYANRSFQERSGYRLEEIVGSIAGKSSRNRSATRAAPSRRSSIRERRWTGSTWRFREGMGRR